MKSRVRLEVREALGDLDHSIRETVSARMIFVFHTFINDTMETCQSEVARDSSCKTRIGSGRLLWSSLEETYSDLSKLRKFRQGPNLDQTESSATARGGSNVGLSLNNLDLAENPTGIISMLNISHNLLEKAHADFGGGSQTNCSSNTDGPVSPRLQSRLGQASYSSAADSKYDVPVGKMDKGDSS